MEDLLMTKNANEITITKEAMEICIKHAFYSGMTYGYGVNHENIHEDEDIFWNEFWNNFKNNHALKL
jgi:hypothetical protein